MQFDPGMEYRPDWGDGKFCLLLRLTRGHWPPRGGWARGGQWRFVNAQFASHMMLQACQISTRDGHFRYSFNFFNNKKWLFAIFFIKLTWLGVGIFYYWKKINTESAQLCRLLLHITYHAIVGMSTFHLLTSCSVDISQHAVAHSLNFLKCC